MYQEYLMNIIFKKLYEKDNFREQGIKKISRSARKSMTGRGRDIHLKLKEIENKIKQLDKETRKISKNQKSKKQY